MDVTFDATTGVGNSYMGATANKAGITGYVGVTTGYTISGGDKNGAALGLALTNGT